MITPTYINTLISSEIPNKIQDPEVYEVVSQFMMHGPCGPDNANAPCTEDKVCTKKFPKSFHPDTTIDETGHPVYRRRNDER